MAASPLAGKKVAIVHDWLIGGGAERVVLELHRMFPDAPIYTSYCTDEWRQRLDNKVITGYLQHAPFPVLRKFTPFLRQWWFPHLDLSQFDVVISSSGAEAKGIKVPQGTTHINYCHAPTHYYWSRYNEYMQHPGFGILDPLARLGLKLLLGPLRRWDYKAAQRPDFFIANSTHIKNEIKKYYGRDATVIHPPIDVERFPLHEGPRQGFIIAGRQTPYKRFDLAVAACSKLNVPLKVIGGGPDHARLVRMAGPSVQFLTGVKDDQMAELIGGAQAFIFPNLDDFGVVAVEALSTGTPLIAYQAGGALDYVEEGKTGLFFTNQTVDSLCGALKTFTNYQFDAAAIHQAALQYDTQHFREAMQAFLTTHITKE